MKEFLRTIKTIKTFKDKVMNHMHSFLLLVKPGMFQGIFNFNSFTRIRIQKFLNEVFSRVRNFFPLLIRKIIVTGFNLVIDVYFFISMERWIPCKYEISQNPDRP